MMFAISEVVLAPNFEGIDERLKLLTCCVKRMKDINPLMGKG